MFRAHQRSNHVIHYSISNNIKPLKAFTVYVWLIVKKNNFTVNFATFEQELIRR